MLGHCPKIDIFPRANPRSSEPKDLNIEFSEQAKAKMEENPDAAAFVRETNARIRQVMAEFEAGRFASLDDALRSIGMEPVEEGDKIEE